MKPPDTAFAPGEAAAGGTWVADLGQVNRLLAESRMEEAWAVLSGVGRKLCRTGGDGPDPEAARAYLGEGGGRSLVQFLLGEMDRALSSCASLRGELLLELSQVEAALRFEGLNRPVPDAPAWLSELT